MARYLVRDPVEINWRVYKRGDIVNFTPKEGEVVTWGTLLKDAPAPAAEAPKADTLSALARQALELDVAALARKGASMPEDPTGQPVGIPPRRNLGVIPSAPVPPEPPVALSAPPDPAPTPPAGDILS